MFAFITVNQTTGDFAVKVSILIPKHFAVKEILRKLVKRVIKQRQAIDMVIGFDNFCPKQPGSAPVTFAVAKMGVGTAPYINIIFFVVIKSQALTWPDINRPYSKSRMAGQ